MPSHNPSFREHYAQGVASFYAAHGSTYRNPHERQVHACTLAALHHLPAPSRRPQYLDLAAGSGEVSRAILTRHGDACITATDPYTAHAYHLATSLPCLPLSFRQIPTALPPQQFTAIFCSFALHLIGTTFELFELLTHLATRSRWLVVIAPHKKPDMKEKWGWKEAAHEIVIEKVRCKIYESTMYDAG